MSIAMVPALLKGAMALASSTGVQGALALGSAAVGFGQANAAAAASEQAAARQNQYLIDDYDQVAKMTTQEKAAAVQQIQKAEEDGLRTRATIKTAAGEGGVSGLSVAALLSDVYGQEARVRDGVNQNLEGTLDQLSAEKRGMQRNVTETNRANAVARPSAIGAGLGLATDLYGIHRENMKIKKGA